jgi:hypothetical protein
MVGHAIIFCMPKRSRKPADPNALAAAIVAEVTGGPAEEAGLTKNPAAVALGRLGGLKGGAARAKKLSKKRRQEIASKAAKKRWAKKRKAGG